MKVLEIGAAMLGAAVILMAQHYWLRHIRVAAPLTYVAGVIGLNIPLSVLFLCWGDWNGLMALWAVSAAGGLAVVGSYFVDHLVVSRAQLEAAKRDAQTMREHLNGQA